MSDAKLGSDRAFGLTFAGVSALLALRLWHHRNSPISTAAAVAFALGFLALSLFKPSTLRSLNRLWFLFGQLLARVTNPVILGVFYFVFLTPIAILFRWAGNDPLRLKKSRQTPRSYWIVRNPPGPAPESLKDPF
jgi:hypothetical protein